jgi:hypothetical protein
MSFHNRLTGSTTHVLWLAGTAVALMLSGSTVCVAQGTTPAQPPVLTPIADLTTVEAQGLNRALLAERLVARFYNQNADKAYLTASGTATTPTTTPPVVVPGITQPGTVTPAADPANLPADQEIVFSSTLSGGAMVPPVNSSASATARFALDIDRRTTQYEIRLTGLSSPVTEIHLHQAKAGEPGGIIHHGLANPVNGVSSGAFPLRTEERDPLVGGNFFIEVHTEQYPLGELRGQVALVGTAPPGTTFPGGATVPPITTVPPVTTPGGTRESLRQMVVEFRDHHNAHVTALEQTLGTGAQPLPTFQNLDAPDLSRFLIMAQTLEEFAAGTHQFLISGPGLGATLTALPEATPRLVGLLAAIGFDDAHHAGALRAYRKTVSTAEGGDPNLVVTEGGAFVTPRSADQVNAFVQPYLVTTGGIPPATGTAPPTTGTTPPTGTGTQPTY